MTSLHQTDQPALHDAVISASLRTMSKIFSSLGRVLICLDGGFRVLHASANLDEILGEAVAEGMNGHAFSEYVGEELFGTDGTLRLALEQGERREGWRALLRCGDALRLVSLSAAPLPGEVCDQRVKYVVVVRPAEQAWLDEPEVTNLSGVIARSGSMRRVFQLVENLAGSTATVLLTGESGTGKELVARAIHAHSPRRRGAFIAINCGAIPSELLESELFGHSRGAFTGAVRDRVGRFEAAAGGTLFLDEIGDLPFALQVKLLRVLQERTFERVGENHTRTADARIIAATHLDLHAAVRDGRFREDLYYRLRVVPIDIPPLRARREDIEPLARFLQARIAARYGRQLRLSPDVVRLFLQYDWPGNVREMENAIEFAVAVVKGETILPEDLPPELSAPANRLPRERMDDGDREIVRSALEAAHWRRDDAARALRMSRTTLWRRMRELGLAGGPR